MTKKHKAFLMVTKETATMTTISEAINIPEPPNVFIYRGEATCDIPLNVTHVKVDPSVYEIHLRAFENCQSLVEIEFSVGLQRIEYGAFLRCYSLKHINKLPSTLEEIHDNTFQDCQSLVQEKFPRDSNKLAEKHFGLATD
jgi:hypothetical protein